MVKFKTWHKTRVGNMIMGVLELLAAYIIGSRAIDTGSIWEYLLAIILLIGAIQNLVRFLRKVFSKNHGKN